MEIAYHIGAHCTDDDRMVRSLLKNAPQLQALDIAVPGPGRYRNLIRESIQGLRGVEPSGETREILLEAICEADQTKRLVMSNPNFICVVKRIFEDQLFYHLIDEKVGGMRKIFRDDDIHYFIGLRNVATFIPAVFAQQTDLDYDKFMRGADPRLMRWTHVVERIRRADPKARLTVWRDEDTPYFWAQLIRLIAGLDPMARISAGYALLDTLISEEGMTKFVEYLRANPPQSEAHKRKIIAAFLHKYVKPEVAQVTIDLPGWDQNLVDDLTQQYDEDVARIKDIAGVEWLSP